MRGIMLSVITIYERLQHHISHKMMTGRMIRDYWYERSCKERCIYSMR